MGIKVKAIERNVAFEKGKQKWAYVMQADLYGQLTQSKVIEEARQDQRQHHLLRPQRQDCEAGYLCRQERHRGG